MQSLNETGNGKSNVPVDCNYYIMQILLICIIYDSRRDFADVVCCCPCQHAFCQLNVLEGADSLGTIRGGRVKKCNRALCASACFVFVIISIHVIHSVSYSIKRTISCTVLFWFNFDLLVSYFSVFCCFCSRHIWLKHFYSAEDCSERFCRLTT